MIRRNNPRVRMVIGNVRMIRMGFKIAFRKANTNEKIKAVA
jgi:hypothetical protein